LVNALEAFGASQAARSTAAALMVRPQRKDCVWGGREGFIAEQLTKCVRRWVLRQMGMAA